MKVHELIGALSAMRPDSEVNVNVDEEFIPVGSVRESQPAGLAILECGALLTEHDQKSARMTDATKKPDGGPAFPVETADRGGTYTNAGMTLRDYFAAAALPALIRTAYRHDKSNQLSTAVDGAYAVADGMLAQREKS